MGAAAKEAVPALAKALQDPDEDVRAEAAWALGAMGPAAAGAAEALSKALDDGDHLVCAAARAAQEKIGK